MQVLNGGDVGPFRSEIFIGGDDCPLTFKDMMNACTEYGPFEGCVDFTGPEVPAGKTIDSSETKQKLQWTPKYQSFVEFMKMTKGQDWYSLNP